ncbi:MAG: hypothetical protein OXG15_06955 [Gammaproteobacteria bacterium]|nr:hypothetical protein [Gammaproteobacteria bacterium]
MARRSGVKRDKPERPVRTTVAFNDEELDIVHEQADSTGNSFQRWARTRLMAAAKAEADGSQDWQRYLEAVEADDANN